MLWGLQGYLRARAIIFPATCTQIFPFHTQFLLVFAAIQHKHFCNGTRRWQWGTTEFFWQVGQSDLTENPIVMFFLKKKQKTSENSQDTSIRVRYPCSSSCRAPTPAHQVCTRTETPAWSLFSGTGSITLYLLKVNSPPSKAFQSWIKALTVYSNSQEEKMQEISQVIRNSSLQFPPPFHTNPIKNSSNTITEKDWVVFSPPFYSYWKRHRAHFYTKKFLSTSPQATEFKDNQIPLAHVAACTLGVALLSDLPDIPRFFLNTCSSLNFNY